MSRYRKILLSILAILTILGTAVPVRAQDTLLLAEQEEHPALMETYKNGAFYTKRPLTRAQMCEYIASLVELPKGYVVLEDMKLWDEGYGAVSSLWMGGVLDLDRGDCFRPEDIITRAEFSDLLSSLAGRLEGEAAGRAQTLAEQVASASLGYEGDRITRGETAVVLVTLSGRVVSEAAILADGAFPPDVTTETPGWLYIVDAVTEGSPEDPAQGPFRAQGWLYCADGKGGLVRDLDVGVWTFDPEGKYTTGNEDLDTCLRTALEESGANDLEGTEALKAVYLYIKDHFDYRVSPEEMETVPENTTGWEYERARMFFENSGGTCYGYAATFGLLARCLGEEAYILSAEVNQYDWPHGFVVIPEDGTDYIYDVELEDTRPERHSDLELFAIENHTVYHYWYEPQW